MTTSAERLGKLLRSLTRDTDVLILFYEATRDQFLTRRERRRHYFKLWDEGQKVAALRYAHEHNLLSPEEFTRMVEVVCWEQADKGWPSRGLGLAREYNLLTLAGEMAGKYSE